MVPGMPRRRMREPWLPWRVAPWQPVPIQGPLWDISKDALLGLMQYARPQLNFNVLLGGVTFFTS